mgnify:CR=1 FL=1
MQLTITGNNYLSTFNKWFTMIIYERLNFRAHTFHVNIKAQSWLMKTMSTVDTIFYFSWSYNTSINK